ncbi:MAG: hypothetical protein ACI9MR_000739 [Myxococcota bacterium]|jgi:hypothetical protein
MRSGSRRAQALGEALAATGHATQWSIAQQQRWWAMLGPGSDPTALDVTDTVTG